LRMPFGCPAERLVIHPLTGHWSHGLLPRGRGCISTAATAWSWRGGSVEMHTCRSQPPEFAGRASPPAYLQDSQ
ncbi:MAG: hypothetical protein WCK27_30970, partial [Verrucomicrobiota bacterium]